jgi:phage-related protein
VKVQEKIDQVLFMIGHSERVPEKFLKHVEGVAGLYEIRVLRSHIACRIFCFFKVGGELVLLNGFIKKSAKTPSPALHRAIRLMKACQHHN